MRGQASLEFLTTYGWAFLVIIVMIGAISYFGVTNPTMFVPERCQFSPEVSCEDFYVTQSGSLGVVMLDLRQKTGRTAYIEGLECSDLLLEADSLSYYHESTDDLDEGNNALPPTDPTMRQWDPAERVTLKCLFSPNPFEGIKGERVRIPLELTIKKRDDGFDHVIQGELTGTVQ